MLKKQKKPQKTKKVSKKLWITKGIQNAIKKKNRLFEKYIKCSDCNKNVFHQEYKNIETAYQLY